MGIRALCTAILLAVWLFDRTAHAQAGAAPAQNSLARLFSPRPVANDADGQLAGVLRELEARPQAAVARPALVQARAALAAAADLVAHGAEAPRSERQKQIAWSALLLADRLIARAEFAAAHTGLVIRARQAEAEAEGAPGPVAVAQTAKGPVLPADLVARADRAREAAARASDPSERADHVLRAQLLLAAAQAEAERIEFERAIERLEQRMAAAVLRSAQAQRDTRERQAEQRRQLASTDQQRLAARAFDMLAGERSESPSAEGDRQLVAFVLQRARARVAAASALEPNLPEIATAHTKLAAAHAQPESKRRALAAESLQLAEVALGAARAKRSAPGAAQARDLMQNARERGVRAEWRADGVELLVERACAGPAPEAQRRLQLLRDLLPAYPHGPVLIRCAASGSSPAAVAQVRARASAARDFLARRLERSRFELGAELAGSDTDLHLVFGAYGGPRPPSTTSP